MREELEIGFEPTELINLITVASRKLSYSEVALAIGSTPNLHSSAKRVAFLLKKRGYELFKVTESYCIRPIKLTSQPPTTKTPIQTMNESHQTIP